MPQRIVFTGKQEVSLESFTPASVGPNQVGVRSLYSLMSTGTENICFNRLFEPGSHWDGWVKYPFYPGYSMIGEVAEVGSDVTALKVGDTVALRAAHASWHVTDADKCYPVSGVDLKEATWFALAKICFRGAFAANYRLGDSVLVVGAGPIGQLSARWARAAGAETVIMVDPVETRRVFANNGGITDYLALPVDGCRDEVSRATGGRMPKIVIDSTGHAAVFSAALSLAANRGRVVILGDTGSPSQQSLSKDVLTRGLTIIGVHDSHDDEEWNNTSITRLFFEMVRSGRISVKNLITDEFLPSECVQAYGAANSRRGETMGIMFDWTKSS
jgi:2-desacetyl-2-hydroxyethyl bacteriochlorophyllide A dehydrogenase